MFLVMSIFSVKNLLDINDEKIIKNIRLRDEFITTLSSKQYELGNLEALYKTNSILKSYPRFFSGDKSFENLLLDTSYKGFLGAKELHKNLVMIF